MSSAARILKEGVIGGLVACVSAIALFSLLDLARGESVFYTPAAMGSVLFYGLGSAGELTIWPGPVLAYNGVHLVGSIAVGLVAALLIFETELHRSLWYLGFMALIAACAYSVAVFGVVGVEIAGLLDWGTVVAGTAVWALSMTAYFWWVHPGLAGRIQHDLDSEI